jgi:hypothetical protein
MTICSVEFLPNGEAIINADIIEPTATDEACFTQCINAFGVCDPTSFRAHMTYTNKPKSMTVDVTVLAPLIEDIPLLADICGSTSKCRDSTEDCTIVQSPKNNKRNKSMIDAPVSVWGLISVLLLKEGVVNIDEWLAKSDVDLPRQTIQVRIQ